MREERIKALVLAALIAAEIIPIDGALIERVSKALDRAAATLIKEMGIAAAPVSEVPRVRITEEVLPPRYPGPRKSAAQRRKEDLNTSRPETPDSPDDSPPSAS